MLVNWQPPKRNDEEDARRWRGPLFFDLEPPVRWWREKAKLNIERLDPPKSVTFAICCFCSHIIWDWPFYEEEVPANSICSQCFKEEEEANDRDNNR